MPNNPILGDGGLHHMALRVRDLDASVAFYTRVLGCVERVRWNDPPKRIVLLDTGNGSHVELFEGGGASPPRPEDAFWHLAFRVPSASAAYDHCRAAGCESYVEPKDLKNLGNSGIDVRVAFVKGPDGELLEFFESAKL